jgi:putative transposase
MMALFRMVLTRERIEAWRIDYNTERPHSALGHLTSRAFARQAQQTRRIS